MRFLRMGYKPDWGTVFILGAFPIILSIAGYFVLSYYRHIENPHDKITPTLFEIAEGFRVSAFEPNRKGEYQLWVDIAASGKRYFAGLAITFLAVPFAVYMGRYAWFKSVWYPFLIMFRMIPALSLLSILFIIFGLGEESKIVLIAIGTVPAVLMEVYQRTRELPEEEFFKLKTLGASDLEICFRVMFTQVWPYALIAIKSMLGPAAMLLIAAESIAASEGIGYRIFVVRRYIGMDIIIPYVIVATMLLSTLDLLFAWRISRHHLTRKK